MLAVGRKLWGRLEEPLAELSIRLRALRQEEITEEIEMILLGTGSYTPLR